MNATRAVPAALLAALSLLLATAPALAGETFTARAAPRVQVLTGFTRARAEMDLTAEESGRVVRVARDVGQAMDPSGVFACQDPAFLRLDLEANAIERARLASLMAYLDKEAGRYRTLVDKAAAEQSALDRLEQDLDAARFQLSALETAGRVLAERLDRLSVKAPPGWIVSERLVEPGQWVAAGTKVGRAGDYSLLVVPFALSPQEYAALRAALDAAGDGPTLTLPDMDPGGRAMRSRLYRVSPAFDPETRKIVVELALGPAVDQASGQRAPWARGGLRAVLELAVDDESGAVLAPAQAVAERYEQHWLTRADGTEEAVVVLGPGPGATLRVASPRVAPGQSFMTLGTGAE